MSVRSNTAAQLAQDMQRVGNAAVQAKQTYDKGILKAVELKYDSLYSDFQLEIMQSNDYENYGEIVNKYQGLMNDYLNEIKAPSTVRSQVSSNGTLQYAQKMKNAAETQKINLFWNDSKVKWESYITAVGSDSNLDYNGKKEALQNYWNEVGVGNIPKSIVGNVTSVDDAISSMIPSCATQYIDRLYATGEYEGMSEQDMIDAAIDSINASLPDDAKLDPDTEFVTRQGAQSQINAHENEFQQRANELQDEVSAWRTQMIKDGHVPTSSEILAKAEEYGAFNADGSINKYWYKYIAGYENLMIQEQNVAAQEALARQQAQEALDADTALWTAVEELSGKEWMELFKTYTPSGVGTPDGTVASIKGKDETFTFGIEEVHSEYGGFARAMAAKLGIEDVKSPQFREVLRQATAMGKWFEEQDALRQAEIDKAVQKGLATAEQIEQNAILRGQQKQLNSVSDAVNSYLSTGDVSGTIWEKAMILASNPGASLLYSRNEQADLSQFEVDLDSLAGKHTYDFSDIGKASITTEYNPMVEKMAELLGITDKKSQAFYDLVIGVDYLGSLNEFMKVEKTPEQIRYEQIQTAAELSFEDILNAVDEVETGIPMYRSTRGRDAYFTANTPMISAEGEQVGKGETVIMQDSALGMFMDENGIHRNLVKEKTYTANGIEVTTQWGPVVDRIVSNLGLTDAEAISLIVSKVDYYGNEANRFAYGARDYYLQQLRDLYTNPTTLNRDYEYAVSDFIASGKLTEQEIKDAGLENSNSAFWTLDANIRTGILNKAYALFDSAYYGSSKETKDTKTTYGSIYTKDSYRDEISRLIEIAYNSDPGAFSTDLDGIIKSVVDSTYSKELNDAIDMAVKSAYSRGNYHEEFSTANNVYELMQGIYNPGIRNGEYVNYTNMINPIVLTASQEYLDALMYGNTNFVMNGAGDSQFNWKTARDTIVQNLAVGYSSYEDLPNDRDKYIVDLCLLKTLYEYDFEETTKKRFSVGDSSFTIIADGYGPCLVDPTTKRLYLSNGDAKTSNSYSVASLSDDQLRTLGGSFSSTEMVSRDFINGLTWEWENENFNVINGRHNPSVYELVTPPMGTVPYL